MSFDCRKYEAAFIAQMGYIITLGINIEFIINYTLFVDFGTHVDVSQELPFNKDFLKYILSNSL